MKIINNIDELSLKNTALCIGNFDGFHLGHKKIISTLKEESKDLDLQTVILTFNPHPFKFFQKDISLISSPYQRLELFKNQNIDYLISLPFDEYLSSLSARDFFENIIVNKLDAKIIVVGVDYRFGAARQGDIHLLSQLCENYGIKSIFVEKVKDNLSNDISSSYIRKLVRNNDLQKVKKILGRYYSVYGKVVYGKGKGKTFGYPTINIDYENELLINAGSYATDTVIDGKKYKSMTYVGSCSSVTSDKNIKIETNIFNFNEDIYGKYVEVFFKEFIREDEKFNSIDKLIEAISKDKIKAENCE